MTTIKKIAEETGFSPSTVSIVLRGEAEQRKISEQTQKIILSAARQMGYRPNTSARRLRNQGPNKRDVAVFWTTDFRADMLGKFLWGLQNYITSQAPDINLVICPYAQDHLKDLATPQYLQEFNGALICNASNRDVAFISQLDTSCPLLIYNRELKGHYSVGMDNYAVGRSAAEKLLKDHCRRGYLIWDGSQRSYDRSRAEGFVRGMKEAGVPLETLVIPDNTVDLGRQCSERILPIREKCGVFSTMDMAAVGLVRALVERRILLPEQAEVIAIGTNNPMIYSSFTPGLTTILIPLERLGEVCISQLDRLMQDGTLHREVTYIPTTLQVLQTTLP